MATIRRSDELISWHVEEQNSEEKLSRESSIHEKWISRRDDYLHIRRGVKLRHET